MLEISVGMYDGKPTEIRGDVESLKELVGTIQRAILFGSDVSDILQLPRNRGPYQIEVMVESK